jgi:hypothetical protein
MKKDFQLTSGGIEAESQQRRRSEDLQRIARANVQQRNNVNRQKEKKDANF